MAITVKNGKKALAIVAAAGLLAALAACSGDSNPDATGGDGDSILVGVITNTGSALSNYPDIQVGAQAAVAAINDDGGINGKTLQMEFCNTRGDTNQAATCGRVMEEKGVVAVVGQASAYAAATLPITEAAGIPDIGILPLGEQETWTSEFSNPMSAGHPGNTAAGALGAAELGLKSFVVICVDSPGGNAGAQIGEDTAKGAGLEVKDRIRIPTTGVTDYTPYIQQAENSKADAVYIVHGPVVVSALLKARKAIGSDVQVFVSGFTLGQSEAAAIPDVAGDAIEVAPLPSIDDDANETVTQYKAELDAAGVPDTKELRRLAGLNAWLAMHAAAETFRGIDGDVTKESVVEALKAQEPIELAGGVVFDSASLGSPDLGSTYPRVPKVPVYFYTFKDGKMLPADGLESVDDAFQYLR
jgi:branched-chain amino acid transport system substrate-binding protein